MLTKIIDFFKLGKTYKIKKFFRTNLKLKHQLYISEKSQIKKNFMKGTNLKIKRQKSLKFLSHSLKFKKYFERFSPKIFNLRLLIFIPLNTQFNVIKTTRQHNMMMCVEKQLKILY